MRHADRRNTLKERFVRGRARNTQDFWAVRNVDIQIPKGSVYGLIGHNGSGKSTLLKLDNRHLPTHRRHDHHRRPGSSTHRTWRRLPPGYDRPGEHPLNGSILGLSKSEIEDAMDTIIDFSGLREFIDDPVKHYSSGMYVRLGFSVAVHMKPDVLLVDEVLAVGDEEFQRKCFDHLYTCGVKAERSWW